MSNKRSHAADQSDSYRPHKSQKQERRPQAHHTQHQPYPHGLTIEDLDRKHPQTSSIQSIPPHTKPPSGSHDSRSPRTIISSTPAGKHHPPLPTLPKYLRTAPFTHSSTSGSRDSQLNYERLEFLGDAYLETIATRLIYTRFPELPVGRQSLFREKLVRNSTLATFARYYNFQDRIIRSGPDQQGQKGADKVLGDVVEAYLGAVILADWKDEDDWDGYVDGARPSNFDIAEAWLTALWLPILLEEDPNIKVVENRKEELAKLIGGKFVKIEYLEERPMYLTKDKSVQQYTMGVYMTGYGYEKLKMGEAVAINKKEAGMRAAAEALDNCPELPEIATIKRKEDAERKARLAKEKEERSSMGDSTTVKITDKPGFAAGPAKGEAKRKKSFESIPGLAHGPDKKSMSDVILEAADLE